MGVFCSNRHNMSNRKITALASVVGCCYRATIETADSMSWFDSLANYGLVKIIRWGIDDAL